MKKILCLVLLIGFAYSQTGNEFLKNYPFDKKIDEMKVHEQVYHGLYNAQINGIRSGNAMTVALLHQSGFDSTNTQLINLNNRTCDKPVEQIVRIIKKWCDDNPTETHNSFESLVFTILFQLPIEDCE